MDTDSVKLKMIFEKVAKKGKTGGELNAFLLFDASGSVSDSDFFKALNTGVMLRDTFDSRVKMGALQFSCQVHTIVPLTDNVEHFKSVLSRMEVHQTQSFIHDMKKVHL
jgi:Mg-chelatase subunit ChlD